MLSVQNLSVAYNGKSVLDDINLEVTAGQITALIGPNGAGKSTLIRAISGVQKTTTGSIQLMGKSITELNELEHARKVAVVPQGGYLPLNFTVYQTVLFGRTPYLGWLGRPNEADLGIVQTALEQTEIDSLAERPLGKLSGGERQRVLLARALAQAAPILLLDEPTTHLDLHHQTSFLKLVRQQVQEKKLAVLIVLHDLNLASIFADQVGLLVAGKLGLVGPPKEVLTLDNLAQIYGESFSIIHHASQSAPIILPKF